MLVYEAQFNMSFPVNSINIFYLKIEFDVELTHQNSAQSANRLKQGNSAETKHNHCQSSSSKPIINDEYNYPWIRLLPAPVQPKGTLALCIALRVKALLAHVHGDVGHRFGQHVMQLLQMNVALLVDHVRLVEYAVHVAFQSRIFVNFAVAKLFDRLCAITHKHTRTRECDQQSI